jgi:hypothetical protein
VWQSWLKLCFVLGVCSSIHDEIKTFSFLSICDPNQEIHYTGGRGWYRMCSRQPTMGLVASKIKQNIFIAQTATFLVD